MPANPRDDESTPTPEKYINVRWAEILAYLSPEDRKVAVIVLNAANAKATKTAERISTAVATPFWAAFGAIVVYGGLITLIRLGSCADREIVKTTVRAEVREEMGAEMQVMCEAAQKVCDMSDR